MIHFLISRGMTMTLGSELIFLMGFFCGSAATFCGLALLEKILARLGVK